MPPNHLKTIFPSKERHLRTPTPTFEVRTPISKAIWKKKQQLPPTSLFHPPASPTKKSQEGIPPEPPQQPLVGVLPVTPRWCFPNPRPERRLHRLKEGHGKWEMVTFVRVKPIKNFFVPLPTSNFESRKPPPQKKRGGRKMEIYSCGFYFPEESGVNDFRTQGVFLCLAHWKFFQVLNHLQPCYLLAVTHRLRSP